MGNDTEGSATTGNETGVDGVFPPEGGKVGLNANGKLPRGDEPGFDDGEPPPVNGDNTPITGANTPFTVFNTTFAEDRVPFTADTVLLTAASPGIVLN